MQVIPPNNGRVTFTDHAGLPIVITVPTTQITRELVMIDRHIPWISVNRDPVVPNNLIYSKITYYDVLDALSRELSRTGLLPELTSMTVVLEP